MQNFVVQVCWKVSRWKLRRPEDYIKADVTEIGLPGREVDDNGLGLCAKVSFSIKRIELSGPTSREVVLRKWKQCVFD
jgi:hypothetical protein